MKDEVSASSFFSEKFLGIFGFCFRSLIYVHQWKVKILAEIEPADKSGKK
ncbi:MAG: hypothetical protein WKF71_03590 [Pyrinomonadaceae bacterium]